MNGPGRAPFVVKCAHELPWTQLHGKQLLAGDREMVFRFVAGLSPLKPADAVFILRVSLRWDFEFKIAFAVRDGESTQ